MLSASKDGGITFSAPVNLSNTSGSSFNPQIVAVGQNVYVAWADRTYGNDEVLFAASRDNGTTFKEVADISNSSIENSADPRIAAAGKYVYIAWTETNPDTGHEGIMLRVSADGGRTFGDAVNLSGVNSGSVRNPQVAATENHVYVTWSGQRSAEDGTSEIFLRISRDNGQSFGDIVNLSQTADSESVDQRLAVSGDNLYVVWHDYNSTISDVLFKKVGNGGATSGNPPINLSRDDAENAAGWGGSAQLAVSGNNVYVIWYEFTSSGNNTLLFRSSDDGGDSFKDKLVIANTAGAAFPQQIAASDRDVYIVWQSNIDGNNNEVFFSESHDGGQSFQSPINLSNSSGVSYSPQVATVKGSDVYVAWIDNAIGSSGTKDIVFGKGTFLKTSSSMQSPQHRKPTKQIIITEVELSSANGTQWIEVYNPTDQGISIGAILINASADKDFRVQYDGSNYSYAILPPKQYRIIAINDMAIFNWSSTKQQMAIYDTWTNPFTFWDMTPELTDNERDRRTWQLVNGTGWVFVEATPERPPYTYATEYLDPMRISVDLANASIGVNIDTSGIFKAGLTGQVVPTIFNGTDYIFDVYFTTSNDIGRPRTTPLESVDYNVVLLLNNEVVFNAAEDGNGQSMLLHASRSRTAATDIIYGITNTRVAFNETGSMVARVIVHAVNSEKLDEPETAEFVFLVEDSHKIPEFGAVTIFVISSALAAAIMLPLISQRFSGAGRRRPKPT
ncbi:MAG TPA: sialidase family protein [Nitrososphaera sp.]